MSQDIRKFMLMGAAAVVLIVAAYAVATLLFGGGDDGPGPRFEVERTDDNNVVCFECGHRFKLTWEQLGQQSAAGRTATGGAGAKPAEPSECSSCGKKHLRFQVVVCPSGMRYVAMTPEAPQVLTQEQLDAFCEKEGG